MLVDDWKACTHLVTDRIRRTVKFLCVLSCGKHILNMKWLQDSVKQSQFVDEDKYLLKDSKMEKQYGFKLQKSIKKANGSLFCGYSIFSTPSVKPPVTDLEDIVVASGGKVIIVNTRC